MFGLGLVPLSDTAHLTLELSDLDWAATTQADAVRASEPSLQAPAIASPVQESESSRAVEALPEPLDSFLPANRGLHYLTLLSKSRPPFPELRSAASANADKAHQTSSAQVQTGAQPADKTMKQREKNKGAQKRHRDRIRVRHTQMLEDNCSPALPLLIRLFVCLFQCLTACDI